jgi:hypothetical protein
MGRIFRLQPGKKFLYQVVWYRQCAEKEFILSHNCYLREYHEDFLDWLILVVETHSAQFIQNIMLLI